MAKHVQYDANEVTERMTHEFTKGMAVLDELEAQTRELLDVLTGAGIGPLPNTLT